jgi:hypothetical protein
MQAIFIVQRPVELLRNEFGGLFTSERYEKGENPKVWIRSTGGRRRDLKVRLQIEH